MRQRLVDTHMAKLAVDKRLTRCALQRDAQREHRHFLVAGARLRQAERHLTLDVLAIEAGDHLQLLDFFVMTPRRSVEVRKLLARGDVSGRERDGLFKRQDGIADPMLVAETEAKEI